MLVLVAVVARAIIVYVRRRRLNILLIVYSGGAMNRNRAVAASARHTVPEGSPPFTYATHSC